MSLRKPYERPPRVYPQPIPEDKRVRSIYAGSIHLHRVCAVPKDVRDLLPGDEDRLWAHVRSLPCARCLKEGRTQLSHSNQTIDGKGKSIKSYPWRVAALCVECHTMIDQGKDMSRAERMEVWNAAHRWTIGELFCRGLVRPV